MSEYLYGTPYPEFTGQETYVPNAYLKPGNPGVWGTAGFRKPKPKRPKRPKRNPGLFAGLNPLMSEEQLRKAALVYVNEILGAQQGQLKSAYETKNANLQAAYAALANIAKGISPAVSQAYNTGSQAISGAAQGFTGAVRGQQEATAAEQNAVLANLGSPQQITSGFTTGGGDAAYAIGGYIPASTMAREGSAYSAAAANLPYSTGLMGVEGSRQLGREYEDQVKELEAQRQEMLFNAINALSGRDQARYTSARNDRLVELEYGAKQAQAKRDAALKLAELSQEQQQWVAEMELDWAKLSRQQRKDALQAQRWAQQAGVDAAKLTLAQKKYLLDVWKAEHGKLKKAKYTPKQLGDLRAEAASIAQTSYEGGQDVDGEQLEPLDYMSALWEMELSGIPAWMARNYLNRFYKEGERGRPISQATANKAQRGRRT